MRWFSTDRELFVQRIGQQNGQLPSRLDLDDVVARLRQPAKLRKAQLPCTVKLALVQLEHDSVRLEPGSSSWLDLVLSDWLRLATRT